MNKLTKISASALAGSLMSLSANALEVSLSGGASVGIYQSNQTKGSSYFMNDNVMMTISGETDGGLTVTTKLELDHGYANGGATGVFDNRSISIANEMGLDKALGKHRLIAREATFTRIDDPVKMSDFLLGKNNE